MSQFVQNTETDSVLANSVFAKVLPERRILVEDLYDFYLFLAKREAITKPMSFGEYASSLAKALREDDLLDDFVHGFNKAVILF